MYCNKQLLLSNTEETLIDKNFVRNYLLSYIRCINFQILLEHERCSI